MATFRVHHAGELDVVTDRKIGFRVITTAALESFWDATTLDDRHGVYVYSIKRRGRGAALPFYVGKAGKTSFKTETLNVRNRRAFTAALLEGHGTPQISLVVLEKRSGPRGYAAIDALETLLIWVARHRNPALINRRKIDTSPKNLMMRFRESCVVGVLNSGSGRISASAQEFRDIMGL